MNKIMPRCKLINSSRARFDKVCRKCKGKISDNEKVYSKVSTIMKNGVSTGIKTHFYFHIECYEKMLY